MAIEASYLQSRMKHVIGIRTPNTHGISKNPHCLLMTLRIDPIFQSTMPTLPAEPASSLPTFLQRIRRGQPSHAQHGTLQQGRDGRENDGMVRRASRCPTATTRSRCAPMSRERRGAHALALDGRDGRSNVGLTRRGQCLATDFQGALFDFWACGSAKSQGTCVRCRAMRALGDRSQPERKDILNSSVESQVVLHKQLMTFFSMTFWPEVHWQ